MRDVPRAARVGGVLYALWGVVHVAGAGLQISAFRAGGGPALTDVIATAAPAPDTPWRVAAPAAAFMVMGAWNLLVIGLLVTVVALTLNWRNSSLGHALNLGLVGAVDAGLVVALLLPGHMAWADGAIGLVVFAGAALFSTIGLATRPALHRT